MNPSSGPPTKAYVPLFNFWCDLDIFDVAPGVTVQRLEKPPTIENEGMAEMDWLKLQRVDFWLVLEAPVAWHRFSAQMNDWALALWVTRPTKLRMQYRFQVRGLASASCKRLHSQFEWNRFDVEDGSYSETELEHARKAFVLFQNIEPKSRLGGALSLTAEALWQHRWHAAIVLFSAAVEALLTVGHGGPVTMQRARAYAAVTGSPSFEQAVEEFREAYKLRSGIVHGNFELDLPDDRLQAVAQWARLARAIWRVLVDKPWVVVALQGTNDERKQLLASLGA